MCLLRSSSNDADAPRDQRDGVPANGSPPEQPGRRSLVAGLFRLKPGTVLAKRFDDENSR